MDANACVLGTPEECVEACRSIRGRRRRPAALPGQPVQDLARVGHADDRADGDRGHPRLRRLSPRLSGGRSVGQSGGMGRAPGGRWAAGLVGAVASAAIAVAPAGASGSGAHAPKLAQVGHAVFWECPAKTTELLVAVNTLTLHPGATLDISFTVRNTGTTACRYTAPYYRGCARPTVTTLTAGPCGSVGYEIHGPHGGDVWPGPEIVNCPALGFARAGAGRHRVGHGFVGPDEAQQHPARPAGRLHPRRRDHRHFSFPIRVARS